MREVTLGLVQMRMGAERSRNLDKAINMVASASKKGADIVCLPELFCQPYFPRTRSSGERPEKVPGETTELLSEAAKANGVVLVGGSLFEESPGGPFNTSVVFDPKGRLLGKYRKVHLPNDPGFYEQEYFAAGSEYRTFNTGHGKLGVLICFDQWYPEAARALKLMGAGMILYPTAIGTVSRVEQAEGDWEEAWEAVQRGHAIANSVVVATVNRVGAEDGLDFWGGSFVYDQFGTRVAKAGTGEEVLMATVNLDLGREVESGWGFLRNRRADTYGSLVK